MPHFTSTTRPQSCHASDFIKTVFVHLIAFFFILILAYPKISKAAGSEQPVTDTRESERKDQTPKLNLSIVTKGVAQSRDLLGKTASTIGMGLDSVFGSPDKNQPNESAIIMRTGIQFSNSGEAVQINSINFQADLPSTSSKFQLLIRINDENQISEQKETTTNNTADKTSTETGTTNPESFESRVLQANQAGIFIRYIYREADSPWQTTVDNGLQFDTSSLTAELVSYLRVGRTLEAGTWSIHASPSIYWTESSGAGVGFAVHSQKILDQITSLHSSTGINYLFDDDMTYYQHGWQLVKTFTPDLRATYSVTFYTTDEADNLIDEAQIGATLRRRINGNWLFFSVTPADTLKADNNYRSDLSLTLQLEAKFGTQY